MPSTWTFNGKVERINQTTRGAFVTVATEDGHSKWPQRVSVYTEQPDAITTLREEDEVEVVTDFAPYAKTWGDFECPACKAKLNASNLKVKANVTVEGHVTPYTHGEDWTAGAEDITPKKAEVADDDIVPF